jgi:hypothetical protein
MVMGEGFLVITVQGLSKMSLTAGQFSKSGLATTHVQPEAGYVIQLNCSIIVHVVPLTN